jgi:hypothetical protein
MNMNNVSKSMLVLGLAALLLPAIAFSQGRCMAAWWLHGCMGTGQAAWGRANLNIRFLKN